MKYTIAQAFALAGLTSAIPHPQFDFPGFSLPTAGLGSGAGSGSGGSLPSVTGLPSFGSGSGLGSELNWSDLFGGGLGNGGAKTTTAVQAPAPPTATTGVAPAPTGGNAGTIGTSCTTQGSSSGGFGGKENGIVDKNCCTDMTVIFARGTGEGGNVGTVSGPPMFKAIRSSIGNDRVTVQGVDYPASSAGNANLGGDGGKIMAQLVSTALSQCPDTKIILSGYSQGAMVVHNAFNNGVKSSQVAGAVLFGDPLKRQAIGDLSTDKIKQFCGTSDTICGGGGDGGATGGHISYGSSANAAATFATQAAGLA